MAGAAVAVARLIIPVTAAPVRTILFIDFIISRSLPSTLSACLLFFPLVRLARDMLGHPGTKGINRRMDYEKSSGRCLPSTHRLIAKLDPSIFENRTLG
jgi:hypothetical protein